MVRAPLMNPHQKSQCLHNHLPFPSPRLHYQPCYPALPPCRPALSTGSGPPSRQCFLLYITSSVTNETSTKLRRIINIYVHIEECYLKCYTLPLRVRRCTSRLCDIIVKYHHPFL